ncbi:MAG TPA: cyclase family protein [Terriglobales bacterium]|nr:cyclase family protein [Terriglobales bacterium]
MRIRTFVIANALVLAILLFADRRPGPAQQGRYSHVVDLTGAQNSTGPRAASPSDSQTRIVSPAALIPGTWGAGQIPAERLIAPLVVMDLKPSPTDAAPLSVDDIAVWESSYGVVPQGAIVAIRRTSASPQSSNSLPITPDAAQFLMDARYTLGFAIETSADLTSDRTLARQLALHGNYVVEGTAGLTSLPQTGSLVIVAPAKNKNAAEAPVRVLAMVR